MKKYYHAYEDRYRRVYEQGVPYWTASEQEMRIVQEQFDAFFSYYAMSGNSNLIETGCGEGYLASYFIEKGFAYTGIDISSSAIEKAAARVTPDPKTHFICGDITKMESVETDSFDVGVDVYCWQMLVTDPDRGAYLSELSRVLKPGAKMFFLEILQENQFTALVESYDEFVEQFNPDYVTLEDREAFVDGTPKQIRLPRVPARLNNQQGYREELTCAGFEVERTQMCDMGCVIFCANKRS